MKILRTMLTHKCVYWSTPVPDGFGGYTFTNAIELNCRWEDVNERFVSDDNTENISQAKVYVDEDVEVGGYVMLASVGDITVTDNPESLSEAYKIKRFDKLPTLNGKKYLRTIFI